MRRLRVSGSLLATLVLGVAAQLVSIERAHACSCSGGPEIRPDTADAVPTNTKIWIRGVYQTLSCEEPTLFDGEDVEVPVEVAGIGDAVLVITPTAELELGASYRFFCNPESEFAVTEFTVSEGTDLVPPAAPTYEFSRYSKSEGDLMSCGPHDYVHLDVTSDADILALDVAGLATLDPTTLEGSIVDINVWGGSSYSIGMTQCDQNWSFDTDGEPRDVRLGAFDLAGNFGGWTSPQTPDLDALGAEGEGEGEGEGDATVTSGCACATLGASPSGDARLAAWLFAGLAFARRRRSSR